MDCKTLLSAVIIRVQNHVPPFIVSFLAQFISFSSITLVEHISTCKVISNVELAQRELNQFFHFLGVDCNYPPITEKIGSMLTLLYKILYYWILMEGCRLKVKPQ